MRLSKANFAGLTPPGQQSEMKAILGGTWPPLKPLPVFKYETAEYRATIDFDKKRGEWVCRKISLPSNEVQELRGGLRQITLALPHGEAETFMEAAEQQEPEFERETNRRLQAIREWREKYANGTRYFELREFLSERQRTELDDSLRLTLTARQLQFNPKNAADVFDDLSVAGGRFAALIDLAKQKKESQGIEPEAQEERPVSDADPVTDRDQESLGISSPEVEGALNDVVLENKNDAPVPNLEGAELCSDADEFAASSIKNASPEQEQASLTERVADTPTQPLEAEVAEVVDADSPSEVGEFQAVTTKNVFPDQEQASLTERMADTPTQPLQTEVAEVVDADSPSEVDEFQAVTIKNVSPGQEQASLTERMEDTPTQPLETETAEVVDADSSPDVDEFQAVTIKNVSPDQQQAPLAERMAHTPTHPLEAEIAEVVDADSSSDTDDFPAVTIKNVSEEPKQAPFAEWLAHAVSQQREIEASEIADLDTDSTADSATLVEPPHEEERRSPLITGIGGQARASRSFFNRIDGADRNEGLFSADRIEDSYSRFPALRISAFQVNVFAILFLFAVTSFTVGLTVGRGPLGKRLREPPKSLLAADAKTPALTDANSPELPDQPDESSSQNSIPPVASSDDSAGTNRPGDATPSEEKFEESTRGAQDPAEVRPTDTNSTVADSSPAIESKPSPKPELNSGLGDAIAPVVPKVLPPAHSRFVRRPKPVRSMRRAPRSYASYRLTTAIAAVPAAPQPPRASTILVTVPGRGSQPFKVSFPEKTIAATSSLAMTSQLSVLVFPELEPTAAHESARLEAGELVSYGWPRYPRPGDRYGSAQTIRVRASIGQLGQVEGVKFLSGSGVLLAATAEAIRQWRYMPTLLDKRPVMAQQDITIEFRPPQYSSQLRTQHPSHN